MITKDGVEVQIQTTEQEKWDELVALKEGDLKWYNVNGLLIRWNNGELVDFQPSLWNPVQNLLTTMKAWVDQAKDYLQNQVDNATTAITARVLKADHATGRRVTDFTSTNTSLANVTNMDFPIGANEVWSFEYVLYIGSSSVTGIKLGFNCTTGTGIAASVQGMTSATNTSLITEKIVAFDTANTTALIAANSQAGQAFVSGIVQNGATPGVVRLRVQKITSGTATIGAGSYFVARKM